LILDFSFKNLIIKFLLINYIIDTFIQIIGEGKNSMFSNPALKKIAEKYQKTVAQVILRWLVQRNVVVLAKSTHMERI